MSKVVIIGAGGHGREVADILRYQASERTRSQVLGFVDDNCGLHGQTVDGLPVLGDWSWFESIDRAEVAVICAVGQPQICRRLVQRAKALGLSFANAISSLAYVSPLARIGEGVTVFPHVVVNPRADLRDGCIVNAAATVSHDTVVGRYSFISPGVHLAGNVTVGEGCHVGIGANVIPGRSIGSWTIVGAGAVVVHDLPANVTAVGSPAKVIKEREARWYD